MARSIDKWTKRLALVIFRKKYSALEPKEQEFVHYHLHRWNEYSDAITERLKKPMKFKKLCGRDYRCIFCWYINHIELFWIFDGIRTISRYARENRVSINSVKYFRKAILREIDGYYASDLHVGGPLNYNFFKKTEDGKSDYWMFEAFKAWQKGLYESYFCPFIGPNDDKRGLLRP